MFQPRYKRHVTKLLTCYLGRNGQTIVVFNLYESTLNTYCTLIRGLHLEKHTFIVIDIDLFVVYTETQEQLLCNTRILGVQNPGANINTRYAGTKSHTYDV
jgi:hypothetical protein